MTLAAARAPHTRESLLALLVAWGIEQETVEHPPVFTVAESASLKAAIPGAHTKNLFLKDKAGALYLVSAEAHTVIDLPALARVLGAKGRFSFGAPALLAEALGVQPGAVTAFALVNDPDRRVRFALDAALLKAERVNFHPLRNDATTGVSPAGLLKLLERLGRPLEAVDLADPAEPLRIDAARARRHLGRNQGTE